MDYKKAFQRPLEDVIKVLIALALGILPIVNFLVTGYIIKNVRILKKNKNAPLPEWGDWGELFIDGLLAALIKFIYVIPALIMGGLLVLGIIFSGGGIILPFAGGFILALTIIWGILTLPILLLVMYLSPMAIYRFALKRRFKDAFQFKLIFKKCFTEIYLKIFLVMIVYGLGLGFLMGGKGVSYTVIGYLIPMTYMTLLTQMK